MGKGTQRIECYKNGIYLTEKEKNKTVATVSTQNDSDKSVGLDEITAKKPLKSNKTAFFRSISPLAKDFTMSWGHVAFVVVFAVLIATLILSASSVVLVSDDNSQSTFNFNLLQNY